jgi:hypothetical protein
MNVNDVTANGMDKLLSDIRAVVAMRKARGGSDVLADLFVQLDDKLTDGAPLPSDWLVSILH